MKYLIYFLALTPVMLRAQTPSTSSLKPESIDRSAIQWTEGLSWDQIKQKALQENKYIFIDCYATWCGPCKLMDTEAFSNDSVGHFLNTHFISIKVQMDKTSHDNEEIKRWYENAAVIAKKYHVEEYPTFIFLSPGGAIVLKEVGYRKPAMFIEMAKGVIQPGNVYVDPYEEYEQLMTDYKNGKRNYEKYPLMVKTAYNLSDWDNWKMLLKELSQYMAGLNRNERYTKERIEACSQAPLGTSTRLFGFFYRDGKLIDKAMREKGYAARVVDMAIQNEIIMPFYNEQNKSKTIAMSGMYLGSFVGKLQTDSSEADWSKLEKRIAAKFDKNTTRRNLIEAKVEWYDRHRNYDQLLKNAIKLKKWHISDMKINSHSWTAFLISNDKKLLNEYAMWMKGLIKIMPNQGSYLDTYANLLYKLGKRKEAIYWQQKAVELAPERRGRQKTLEDMKQGKQTYLDRGAIWSRIK
ncbi:thioredoxin family protein [Longitalea arenae]|uniref:thioredoxin family protein n=1 Tax=Longitalea arenae TaxID=2812558 RepID=UPI00196767C8|nr:DUF255 domain-containing protein [Longitalea arenae]